MARLMIEMLADARHQETGVAYMHRYLDSTPVSDFERRMTARHFAVIARPEVEAARDAVARDYDIPVINLPL